MVCFLVVAALGKPRCQPSSELSPANIRTEHKPNAYQMAVVVCFNPRQRGLDLPRSLPLEVHYVKRHLSFPRSINPVFVIELHNALPPLLFACPNPSMVAHSKCVASSLPLAWFHSGKVRHHWAVQRAILSHLLLRSWFEFPLSRSQCSPLWCLIRE